MKGAIASSTYKGQVMGLECLRNTIFWYSETVLNMELAYCDKFVGDCVPWVGAEDGLNIKLRHQAAWLRHLLRSTTF